MIGIVVDKIDGSIGNHVMVRELNKLADKVPCFVFTNDVGRLNVKNKFTILQQVEALSHPGTLISTSLITSQVVLNSLTPKKKYLYLQNYEWRNLDRFNALQLHRVFLNDEMDIIVKSDTQKKVFSKLFREPSKVIYNWRADDLIKVI